MLENLWDQRTGNGKTYRKSSKSHKHKQQNFYDYTLYNHFRTTGKEKLHLYCKTRYMPVEQTVSSPVSVSVFSVHQG